MLTATDNQCSNSKQLIHQCLRFGLWLTLCSLNILFTYFLLIYLYLHHLMPFILTKRSSKNSELDIRCEYYMPCVVSSSDVRIFEISNRIVTSLFDLIRNEYKYSKFSNTYRHQFLTYLNRMTPIFYLRNHA